MFSQLSVVLLLAVAVIANSRVADADPDTTTSSSESIGARGQNRYGDRSQSRPAPRYFDEFLQLIAITGEVPDINADGTYTFPRHGRLAQASGSQRNSSNPMSSRHHRRRHHRRPSMQSRVSQLLQSERDNGNLAQGTSNSPSSLRSHVASALRTGSRRNVIDFDRLEAELNGIDTAHWSCCDLGRLAGTRGFLCDAQFYSSRVQLNRLSNRVHNRRLRGTYFDNGAPTNKGQRLISTFNNCVVRYSMANQFQSCCEQESQRDLWANFRANY